MRLIDADAFVIFLKDAVKRQKYEDVKIDGSLTVADVIEAIISELDGTSLVGFKNAPTIEPEPHYCRECKWSRCRINVDKYGNTETYWHCFNWDGGTDEEGYCYEWERRTDGNT